MKTNFIIILLCIACSISAQQHAMFTYYSQLNGNDSIKTEKWLNANPTSVKEKELANKYYTSMNIELREYVSESELSSDDLQKQIEWNFTNEYRDNFWWFAWDYNKYSKIFHSKISIKAFRDLLFNKACDALCDLIAYYPQDYKTHLVKAFTEALNMLNDIPNHSYGIRDSDPMDEWEDLIFFKDGKPDRDLGYGINGFLLRRIYLDNIPYSEIKEKTITLLNKLKAVDNSQNATFLSRYIINNELAYCIGAEYNFLSPINSNTIYIPYNNHSNIYAKKYWSNLIKCRYNAGQNFYVIKFPLYSECEYRYVVIDKNANIIYTEK